MHSPVSPNGSPCLCHDTAAATASYSLQAKLSLRVSRAHRPHELEPSPQRSLISVLSVSPEAMPHRGYVALPSPR